MDNAAIVIEDLCIDYKPLKNMSIMKTFFHRHTEKEKVFHAVKHVSFMVNINLFRYHSDRFGKFL